MTTTFMKIANLSDIEQLAQEAHEMAEKLTDKIKQIKEFEFEFRACETDCNFKNPKKF